MGVLDLSLDFLFHYPKLHNQEHVFR